jgi:SWI/SNF-related matrix-associated actin-dependent regulator 1 of chromatin subfamily A
LIDQFDSDPSIEVFLLSTKAGGVGITLTSASAVIFLDLSFNPQWDRQAEDRAHRIGQTKEVHVYRIIAKDTVEESIWAVQQTKLELHNGVLQEGAAAAAEEGDGEKLKAQDVKKLLAHYFESIERAE